MNHLSLLTDDASGELWPDDLVKRIASPGERGSLLYLCDAPARRDALRQAWFSRADNPLRIIFATFEEIGEHLVPSQGHHSDTSLRAIRRVLLDAAIQSSANAPEMQPFAKSLRSRGFLDAVWRTFDEWNGEGEAESSNLSAIRAMRDRYLEKLRQHGFADPRLSHSASNDSPLPYPTIVIDDHLGSARRWSALIRMLSGHAILVIRTTSTAEYWQKQFPDAESKRIEPSRKPTKLAQHLRKELFQNDAKTLKKAAGLELIEAPGELGEMRMVCRRIRELIAAGADANRIVIAGRRLERSHSLFLATLREYGIPFEENLPQTFARQSAIGSLLAFIRIPENGWLFRDISSLLRSNYFHPAWVPGPDQPTFAREAELFLRYLGEPSSREAFEKGLDTWAISPPQPLEDEDMEHRERARMQTVALRCRPALKRLFEVIASMPDQVPYRTHLKAFESIAELLGIDKSLKAYPSEQRIWHDFISILEALPATEARLSRAGFLRIVNVVARCECDRRSATVGGVRIVSIEESVGLDCDHLFLVGMGEKSFPNLRIESSLLGDEDRRTLIAGGVHLTDPDTLLQSERELFLKLVETPARSLILSYPAFDESGQELLPSTFLRDVRNCYAANAIPTRRKSMVIEGVFDEVPFSAAERRVRYAREVAGQWQKADWNWGGDCSQTIRQAGVLAEARYREKTHNAYDGMTVSEPIRRLIDQKFGERKVFSPTSLEVYIACPFRFLMQHVLGLQKLEEPTEDIEVWRKGMAFHRALSRLHEKLIKYAQNSTVDPHSSEFRDNFESHLAGAIAEYSQESSSAFTRKLWELEGERLRRLTANYGPQWAKFQEIWTGTTGSPQPAMLERSFGFRDGNNPEQEVTPLLIERDGARIQLGGRIDRIDTLRTKEGTSFWIIDYKTGTPSNYNAKMFENMERLQLTLYALAAQKLFFGDQPARPLGLAYWFVAHPDGLKTVYPKVKVQKNKAVPNDPAEWDTYRDRLEGWVFDIVGRIRAGMFPLAPRSEKSCESCPYSESCRISQSRGNKQGWRLEPKGSVPSNFEV